MNHATICGALKRAEPMTGTVDVGDDGAVGVADRDPQAAVKTARATTEAQRMHIYYRFFLPPHSETAFGGV